MGTGGARFQMGELAEARSQLERSMRLSNLETTTAQVARFDIGSGPTSETLDWRRLVSYAIGAGASHRPPVRRRRPILFTAIAIAWTEHYCALTGRAGAAEGP